MQKIRKWERQVGIKGIRIIYPGEENAKRWQLYCSGLLKVTTTEGVPCLGPRYNQIYDNCRKIALGRKSPLCKVPWVFFFSSVGVTGWGASEIKYFA